MNNQKLDYLIDYSVNNILSFNTLESFQSRISALLYIKYNEDIENIEKEISYIIGDNIKKYLINQDTSIYTIYRHSMYNLHDFISIDNFSSLIKDLREQINNYIKYLENIIFS